MNIKIVKDTIGHSEVEELAKEFYRDMIKGVVDLEREIIALGGEYHIDANNVLISDGSKQKDIWGFNLNLGGDIDIEYTALINIRPAAGNNGMTINDGAIRDKMKKIITKRVKND